jgi:hypothetical protein
MIRTGSVAFVMDSAHEISRDMAIPHASATPVAMELSEGDCVKGSQASHEFAVVVVTEEVDAKWQCTTERRATFGTGAARRPLSVADCPDANEQPEDAKIWMDGYKEGQAEKNNNAQ